MERTDAKQAKKFAGTVLSAFDTLTRTYIKLFNLCYEALGPGKTQTERNRVRDALKEYMDSREDGPPNKDNVGD